MLSRTFLSKQSGGTFVGMLIGIVIGLAAAVVTALFVTRANVPFIGSATKTDLPRSTASATESSVPVPTEVPDPNRSLARQREGIGARGDPGRGAVATVTTPEAPADSATRTPSQPLPAMPPARAETSGAPVIVATPSAPARAPAQVASTSPARAEPSTSYLLQAGAYRSNGDAEGMKAKLALMGFEASIASAEINGNKLFRVRVGPYGGLDQMNRARARLAENGIEASVLRQQR